MSYDNITEDDEALVVAFERIAEYRGLDTPPTVTMPRVLLVRLVELARKGLPQ